MKKELATAINNINNFNHKTAHAVFVGGIKYPSLFEANIESGIRSVTIWKAIRKQGGGPVQIRKSLVVMESWVTGRAERLKRIYEL